MDYPELHPAPHAHLHRENSISTAQGQAAHQSMQVAIAERKVNGIRPAFIAVPSSAKHVVICQRLVQCIPPNVRAHIYQNWYLATWLLSSTYGRARPMQWIQAPWARPDQRGAERQSLPT